MLMLWIGERFEELAEIIVLFAIGDCDENRISNLKDALDDFELLSDLTGFFLNRISGVFDQTVGGDNEKKPVDGTIGAIFLQESEEFSPFACLTRFDLLKHKTPSGVEQDGVVREPPIHVDGAADALKFVLH